MKTVEEETTTSTQYLGFFLGREDCAISLLEVREILEYPVVTRVPPTPFWGPATADGNPEETVPEAAAPCDERDRNIRTARAPESIGRGPCRPDGSGKAGGSRGRKVIFHTDTGDVWVRHL